MCIDMCDGRGGGRRINVAMTDSTAPLAPRPSSDQPDIAFVDNFCGFGGFSSGSVMFTNLFFSNNRIAHAGVDCCLDALRQ